VNTEIEKQRKMKHVVIFGHRGALGHSIEQAFLRSRESQSPDWFGWGLDPKNAGLSQQQNPSSENTFKKIRTIHDIPKYQKVDAVICVAGAFETNASEDNPQDQLNRLWAANIEPSFAAANFSTDRKVPKLILTGASSVFDGPCSWAIAYGMCKAAVHHLALSLQSDDMFKERQVVCLLPRVMDTPMNRKSMPHEDFSKWTSTEKVADVVLGICNGSARVELIQNVFARV